MLHNIGVLVSAILFTYGSFLAGLLAFRFIGLAFADKLKERLFAVITGYGCFAFAGLLLAGIGAFTPFAVRLLFAFVIFLSFRTVFVHTKLLVSRDWWRGSFGRARGWFRENGSLKGTLVLWIFLNLFIVFVPLTGHDTLEYHFPIVENLISEGRFTFTGAISSYPFLPVLGETLYATAMLMFGNTAEPYIFQVFQYGMLIFFPLLFHAFLKERIRHPVLAVASAVGILALMDFAREAFHGGYVDLFAFLFGIASVLLVADTVASGKLRRPEVTLSAILLGFSLGVKYTGFFFGAIDAVLLAAFLVQNRVRLREAAGMLSSYAGFVLLVAGFWYIKNFLVFGNPIYPLISNPEWSANINYFLVDRTLLNFILFPFVRYGQWFVQDVETSSRLVVLGDFALLYLTLAAFAVLRKGIGAFETSLLIFIELYLAFLFVSSHQYRFLIPATLALPPLLALLADRLFGWIKERRANLYPRILAAFAVTVNIAAFILFVANIHYFEVKFRYVLGYYDRAEYILEIGGQ